MEVQSVHMLDIFKYWNCICPLQLHFCLSNLTCHLIKSYGLNWLLFLYFKLCADLLFFSPPHSFTSELKAKSHSRVNLNDSRLFAHWKSSVTPTSVFLLFSPSSSFCFLLHPYSYFLPALHTPASGWETGTLKRCSASPQMLDIAAHPEVLPLSVHV